MINFSEYDFLDSQGNIVYPTFIYKDETYVKLSDVMRVAEFQNMLDEMDEQYIKKLKTDIFKATAELEKAKKREESYKKIIAEQKEELKTYDKIYGNYVSPHAIIQLFFRGRIRKYTPANTKSFVKKNMKIQQKQLDYWVNVFLDIGIFFYGINKELIANCEETEAHNLLSANSGFIDKSLIE